MVSHATMNSVGIICEQRSHAGEEHVVLQAQQARCGALAAAEVSGREDRDARRRPLPSRKRKKTGERIAPQVDGQVGQADGQRGMLRRQRETQAATTARAAPHRAPSGNSVRPTKLRLTGRSRPASPIRPHRRDERKAGASDESIQRHRGGCCSDLCSIIIRACGIVVRGLPAVTMLTTSRDHGEDRRLHA